MKVFVTIVNSDGFPVIDEIAEKVEDIKDKVMIYTAELPIGYLDILNIYDNIKRASYGKIKPYSGIVTIPGYMNKTFTYKFEKGELIP